MTDEKVVFLDIIFCNLKFYDNEFILQLLFHYKNKIAISTSDLNQQISNKKFSISINTKYSSNTNSIYLINECNKKNININIIKHLIEYGVNINKEDNDGNSPLFYACLSGNMTVVRYLIEQGANINKLNKYGETPLFYACEDGNEAIVKYLVEQGANINKLNIFGETSFFNACKNGSKAMIKYLIEHGADMNIKKKWNFETPFFFCLFRWK